MEEKKRLSKTLRTPPRERESPAMPARSVTGGTVLGDRCDREESKGAWPMISVRRDADQRLLRNDRLRRERRPKLLTLGKHDPL
jgi:hypothetical protein